MPCGVPGMYDNYDADAHNEIRSLGEKLDDLTYQNDLLREIVLKAYNEGKVDLDDELAHKINVDQMNHRQEDLDRLEKVFLESKDSEKLGKVWSADVQYPLEPQLGFDPNKF